ncbi:Glycosylphosphatidylinositol anchor biosynthesis protein 11 [Talaromyces islandicus]|uniref:Glycosylphosphatidylinositol anchor biosynthesis protein 11 n=1 Tax=Talaromyces islandicus TaxID=28573 RepID=A0A0U1LTE6_TALIS|nr:Glycosylphosphatidylinositol anchor biosynthesis protein 11 [Talaromyces islandicus]
MATTTTSKAPQSLLETPTTPNPPPVSILPTPAAQTYSHVHPALLLALYAVRFPALVADPVSTLLSDLPVFTVLQVAYVVTCLPQAGSHGNNNNNADGSGVGASSSTIAAPSTSAAVGGNTVVKANKAPYRKKHTHASSKKDVIFKKLTAAFLSLTLTFLLGTPVLALLLVLFGAPFTTHNAHTLLCAAHMGLLSVTPLVYVHGVDGTVWKQVWAFQRPADAVWGGALGVCVGAWLGAVPIPLDWDRPWQAFPITVLTGAYLGYAVGQLVARTPLVYGKRIEFNAPSV